MPARREPSLLACWRRRTELRQHRKLLFTAKIHARTRCGGESEISAASTSPPVTLMPAVAEIAGGQGAVTSSRHFQRVGGGLTGEGIIDPVGPTLELTPSASFRQHVCHGCTDTRTHLPETGLNQLTRAIRVLRRGPASKLVFMCQLSQKW
jgi:hypothetical protein